MGANPAKLSNRSRYYQGVYVVQNVDKYLGDHKKCEYRSRWEFLVFKMLDNNPKVVGWGAEPFAVGYVSPKDNKLHRYFPDVIVVADNKGVQVTTLIEIKPYNQTILPKANGKKKSRYIQEVMTYHINKAKWKAAEALCENKGWIFKIMTEKEIKP